MCNEQGKQVQNDSYMKLMLERATTLMASPHFFVIMHRIIFTFSEIRFLKSMTQLAITRSS